MKLCINKGFFSKVIIGFSWYWLFVDEYLTMIFLLELFQGYYSL